MITERNEFEKKLEKLYQEVDDFIDALVITNDSKNELRIRLNSFDSAARGLWSYNHVREKD